MALPIAPLGSQANIGLGGYIPAARRDPKLLEQALAQFIAGAAGTAGNRAVGAVLPDPQHKAEMALRERAISIDQQRANDARDIGGKQLDLTGKSNFDRNEAEKAAQAFREQEAANRLRERISDNTISGDVERARLATQAARDAAENTQRVMDRTQRADEAAMARKLQERQLGNTERATDSRIQTERVMRGEVPYGGQPQAQVDPKVKAAETLGLDLPQVTSANEYEALVQQRQGRQQILNHINQAPNTPVVDQETGAVTTQGAEQPNALSALMSKRFDQFFDPGYTGVPYAQSQAGLREAAERKATGESARAGAQEFFDPGYVPPNATPAAAPSAETTNTIAQKLKDFLSGRYDQFFDPGYVPLNPQQMRK